MCILLYVKLIWCSGSPYIYGQLGGSTSALSICAFCYMLNLCGVVVFHRSIFQLEEGGTSDQVICAFYSMGKFFGVVVFHRSMVNWQGDICPRYMCIPLYAKPIQCSGVA